MAMMKKLKSAAKDAMKNAKSGKVPKMIRGGSRSNKMAGRLKGAMAKGKMSKRNYGR